MLTETAEGFFWGFVCCLLIMGMAWVGVSDSDRARRAVSALIIGLAVAALASWLVAGRSPTI
uniref:Uncharacterized protein n=1 Tax=viral metagenome TaxID=1070528 RepID=A0A6M3IZ05_9ZZZZ